ncbi:toxin co-regulated pilus biosynthesis Q family protein [Polaromonas naphthalenivorans]|uniref:Putative lipoprotein n=1 Tax=Polaromonas naphthalenivorans (strain CJ2) TaxID=365044 RepID=A1VV36_POLNA|nr:toxin co-regulated pilus biosynthesis Q family protein [Polaromonas naphthalenivorans]ABM39514.1 putative lipoprotein [Polaromonas naphthalenivorans CJ2]
MKTTIVLVALIATSGLSFSQVRFIDAPYPSSVSRPALQMPVAQQVAMPVYQATPVSAPAMQAGFEATPADANLRKALVRWTKMIGWTFEPEHWTLDRDIPIAGSASLGSDFKMATRLLLSSTEMTDLPAQPCFYSNNVLRVIPLNELCSRQQVNKTQ